MQPIYNLTAKDVQAFRNIIKLVNINHLRLTPREIRDLLPDHEEVESFEEAWISIWSGEVGVKIAEMGFSRVINLKKHLDSGSFTGIDENDRFNQQFNYLINLLNKVFGFNWLVSQFAETIYRKYDKAISYGQSKALVKKIIGQTLDSTTRSQIHKLKKKIQKYRSLINDLSSIFFDEPEVPMIVADIKNHEFELSKAPYTVHYGPKFRDQESKS